MGAALVGVFVSRALNMRSWSDIIRDLVVQIWRDVEVEVERKSAPPRARTHDAADPRLRAETDTFDFEIAKKRRVSPSKSARGEWMQVALSLIVIVAALFVILSNNAYSDAHQKWAYGAVGMILGFWFKR
jgi:hypothetical protein